MLPHRSLQALAQFQGPLTLLHFGTIPTLVASSANVAQEIMKTHDLNFANQPKSSIEAFAKLTNAIVCRVALGRKYGEGEGGRVFNELLGEFVELLGVINVGDFIPWLAWVNRVNGLDGRAEKLAKHLDDFLEGVIEEHIDCEKKGSRDC
uniref:Cytochrome P450 n=1 Tax=Fagus sylvatica TaxID=28930 RepID=A0A2N9IWB4_FAGSY